MQKKVPKHIAIILDGNGRWAKKRFLPRNFGHRQGAKNIEKVCEWTYDLGVEYLTVYAFSTENWKRDEQEVNALMDIFSKYLREYLNKAVSNNMCVRIIGDRSRLRSDIVEDIVNLETATASNTGLKFQIAINYGGRDEIIRAVKEYINSGNFIDDLTENILSDNLDTNGIPDPDLIIRTSGELRLSNFLIWQGAYSELYFSDVLWPDFDRKELEKAISHYSERNRRYGGV